MYLFWDFFYYFVKSLLLDLGTISLGYFFCFVCLFFTTVQPELSRQPEHSI